MAAYSQNQSIPAAVVEVVEASADPTPYLSHTAMLDTGMFSIMVTLFELAHSEHDLQLHGSLLLETFNFINFLLTTLPSNYSKYTDRDISPIRTFCKKHPC